MALSVSSPTNVAPSPPANGTPSLAQRTTDTVEHAVEVVVQAVEDAFSSHFDVKMGPDGKPQVTNTTGDALSPDDLIIPKATADVVRGKDGNNYVLVGVNQQGQRRWLDTSNLKESNGKDGVYYDPHYQSNEVGAAITGGIRGFATLAGMGPIAGAVGAVVGAGAGAASQAIPTDNTLIKALAGAGLGAAGLAAAGLLVTTAGPALLGLGALGALIGASGSLGGDGEGKVHDAAYAGTTLGLIAPGAAVALPVAAALGAKADNPFAQALISAGLTVGITAASALALGTAPAVAGLVAAGAVGAAAPAVGRVLMNAIRNLGEVVTKTLRGPFQKISAKLSDNELCAVAGLNLAFLGGSIGMIGGPLVGLGAAIVLGTVGAVKARMWVNKLEEQNKEKKADALPAAPADAQPPSVATAPQPAVAAAPPPAPLPEPENEEMAEMVDNIRNAEANLESQPA